jgi:hypothetical protein
MFNQSLITITLAACAATASASPKVVHFTGHKDTNVLLTDYDQSLPNVRLRLNLQGFGGGKATNYYAPVLVEDEVVCFGTQPSENDIEAAELANFDYPAEPGTLLEPAIGGWIYTEPLCDKRQILPSVLSEYTGGDIGGPADCETCYPVRAQIDNVPGEIHYIPFRVKAMSSSDWSYGWVAFSINEIYTPLCYDDTCEPDHPRTRLFFDYVAAGLESEPNTPIIAGGGLCPGDINFDAQRDTFDVFDYLDLFNTMDAAADYDNDGTLDIFDVFAFLDDFQTPCEF